MAIPAPVVLGHTGRRLEGLPMPGDHPIGVGFPTLAGCLVKHPGRALVVTKYPPHKTLPADVRRPQTRLGPQPIVPPSSLIA